MKLRIVTWGLMCCFSALLYFDVMDTIQKILVLLVQSTLIIVNIYLFFKSDKEPRFESDDILDC
jgi:hypothetical protein